MTEYLEYKIQMKLKQNNYKYLSILICTLSLFLCYGFSTYAKPPFPGTAYVDKDIIQKNDPSDFINLEYVGLVKENPYDYRADAWVAQDMFVFNVKYKNKIQNLRMLKMLKDRLNDMHLLLAKCHTFS